MYCCSSLNDGLVRGHSEDDRLESGKLNLLICTRYQICFLNQSKQPKGYRECAVHPEESESNVLIGPVLDSEAVRRQQRAAKTIVPPTHFTFENLFA